MRGKKNLCLKCLSNSIVGPLQIIHLKPNVSIHCGTQSTTIYVRSGGEQSVLYAAGFFFSQCISILPSAVLISEAVDFYLYEGFYL